MGHCLLNLLKAVAYLNRDFQGTINEAVAEFGIYILDLFWLHAAMSLTAVSATASSPSLISAPLVTAETLVHNADRVEVPFPGKFDGICADTGISGVLYYPVAIIISFPKIRQGRS